MTMNTSCKTAVVAGVVMTVITLIYQVTVSFQQTSPDMDVNWLGGFDVLLPQWAAISFSYAYFLWSKKFDLRVPIILILFGAGSVALLFTFNNYLVSLFMPRIIAFYFLAADTLAVILAGVLIPIYHRHELRKEEGAETQI